MAHQFRRGAQDDSSDESDDDYVPPEQVEVEGLFNQLPGVVALNCAIVINFGRFR
jgi:hypothetical protein